MGHEHGRDHRGRGSRVLTATGRSISAVTATANSGLAGGAATGAKAPQDLPKKFVTLGKGKLRGERWRLIAYRDETGLWCEALLRGGLLESCNGAQPMPSPVYVSAGFSRRGRKAVTFAVVATSAAVARVNLKLVPSDKPISGVPAPVTDRERRLAGLPHGFRYFVIAEEGQQGLRSFSAFDAAGNLLGHYDGYPDPPSMPPPATG